MNEPPTDAAPPALSVVMPVYNAAETIAVQLRALADQQVGFAWELVVADNGSTDLTTDLVRQHADRLPLRIVDASSRRGAAAARNRGAEVASSSLLAFCDADDQVTEGWLSAMFSALNDALLVYGSWNFSALNQRPGVALSWTGHVDTTIVKPTVPVFRGIDAANFGISKTLFDQLGGFDEHLAAAEDVDLAWRAQLAGVRPQYHPELVLNVRKKLGLVPVIKQGIQYGTGDRQLDHRWSRVAESLRNHLAQVDGASGSDPVARSRWLALRARARRARVVLTKALRARHRADFGDRAFRIGNAIGYRFGKIGPDLAVIPAPPPEFWRNWERP